MSADHALVDQSKQRIDPLSAETLSTFFHEYFHYLQNISTVSGFAGYHATQQLLALFSRTIDKSGLSQGSARLDATGKQRLHQIASYLDLLEGDEGPERVVLESVKGVDQRSRELPFGNGVARLSEVTLRCEVETNQGVRQEVNLRLGLYAIEEGLAFEIDRIVAGIDGQAVDHDAAPAFPYLVLRHLGEHLAPGIERRDLIACGLLSLLCNDPARAIVDGLRDFGQRRSQSASRDDALAAVELALREARVDNIKLILEDIKGLKKMHASRGIAASAMDRVGELFSVLLSRGLEDPFWDVRPFLSDNLDQNTLTQLLHTVDPCIVIQRLHNNEEDINDSDRPEHDLMLAFGTPGQATREVTKRAIPVLQCQVHYVSVHLASDEFIPSDKVGGTPEAACPFYSSCTLQLRRDHAEVCKGSPWEIYALSQKETCWYGAAVAGTLGTVKLASEPTPSPGA
ncbi:MAG: hypothetical protein U0359_11125 [Byssovorax sp.]